MTDARERPVLIIGTERSGSNLLRLILNEHSSIAVPHPPHFMRYFAPVVRSYGDLNDLRRRRALVRDALTLLRTHIHPWEYPIDPERVVQEAHPSLFGVVTAIYDQYRAATGKERWGCKSTFMVDYIDEVLAVMPEAKFVWLVRDPRDVAASSRKSVFSPYHPVLTAQLWVEQQEKGFAALERLGEGQVHLLRYEDLVSEPEKGVRALSEFLGEPFEPRMLEHHRSSAAKRSAELSESWRSTGKPISAESVGRHAAALTPEETAQVELVAAPLMRRFAYDLHQPALAALPSPLTTHALDILWRVQGERRSLQNDKNHWRRWSRDLAVRWIHLRARTQTTFRW
jgi:hypothetical protein